jgi:CDK5 regulatory subunit-associated protein 3
MYYREFNKDVIPQSD